MNDPSSEGRAGAADVSASQHVMVCALKELGSLVRSLSATASPLIQETSVGRKLHISPLCCSLVQIKWSASLAQVGQNSKSKVFVCLKIITINAQVNYHPQLNCEHQQSTVCLSKPDMYVHV